MADTTSSKRRLAVLMFTDLTDSVGMKRRLGADVFSRTLSRHDEIFKSLIAAMPEAVILKDLGDGFYASFASAGDAVNLALQFQWLIRNENWPAEEPRPRVGIHIGEVMELAPEVDGRMKTIGLDADLTARVMGLSEGGQILMTRGVFDAARQTVREHPPVNNARPGLEWQAYGPYQFKGMDAPHEVFEVGAIGLAPLRPPADSEKARRAGNAEADPTLGWRPAIGLEVPNRPGWRLEGRLGEGGFGEVWLACNRDTSARRAFKFCFDADRLRSFHREVALYKRLTDALGDRNDIARLYDTRFDQSPYFIESEYSEQGNLLAWSVSIGGIGSLPKQVRLDLFCRIATALGAAHSIDIVHKDLKPSNILVTLSENSDPRPKLADFGVGQLMPQEDSLAALGIPSTQSASPALLVGNASSRTGSRLYAAPEISAQKTADKRSDVYSLGVLLYQLMIGRFDRPLASGWERDIPESKIRMLIAQCVDIEPVRRPADATIVANLARQLSVRELSRTPLVAGIVAILLLLVGGAVWWHFQHRVAPSVVIDLPIKQAPVNPANPVVLSQDLSAKPIAQPVNPLAPATTPATTQSVPPVPAAPIDPPPAPATQVIVKADPPAPPVPEPVPPNLDELLVSIRKELPLGIQVEIDDVSPVVRVSGIVLNDNEKKETVKRLSRIDAGVATDRIAVSPQSLAQMVQKDLREAGLENSTREHRQHSSGPWYLRVQLFDVKEKKEQAEQIARRYLIDPTLVEVVVYGK